MMFLSVLPVSGRGGSSFSCQTFYPAIPAPPQSLTLLSFLSFYFWVLVSAPLSTIFQMPRRTDTDKTDKTSTPPLPPPVIWEV